MARQTRISKLWLEQLQPDVRRRIENQRKIIAELQEKIKSDSVELTVRNQAREIRNLKMRIAELESSPNE